MTKRIYALCLCALIAWLILASGAAQAGKPTVSGTLQNYNPGGGRLQIVRADGVVKTIVMRPNAVYALNGVVGSPHYFRNGMKVAVRICGSVTDDPLQGDLLIDAFSSGKIIQRRAFSSNNTTTGTFASVGGANGIASMAQPAPSVVGQIGMGGLNSPISNNPVSNPNPGALAISTISAPEPAKTEGSAAGLMGGEESSPYAASNPYENRTGLGNINPLGAPNNMNNASGLNNASAMGSLMGAGDSEQAAGSGSSVFVAPQASSGPLGMQIAQIQGTILTIDARNRVIAVVPQGGAEPIQVRVPAGVPITNSNNGQQASFEMLRAGNMLIVAGMSNAAGIVEARQITVAI